MKKTLLAISILLMLGIAFSQSVSSQTNEISYQGSLEDEGSPANGSYNFNFRLYDSGTFGNQLGNELSRTNVTVTDGIFVVNNLDFGAPFTGTTIWLEIDVRQGILGEFITLSPRQKITSAPTAIQSLKSVDSDRLGGIPPNLYVRTNDPNFVRTDDSRLTDSRAPTSGSSFYIQNGTSEQSSSNFRISGTGRADKLVAGSNLSVGSTSFSNPLVVVGNGTDEGGLIRNNVVARFRSLQSTEQTAISLDAANNRDTILYFSANGNAKWSIENDESTNAFLINNHSDGATESLFRLNRRGSEPGVYDAYINADITYAKRIDADEVYLTDIDLVGSAPGETKILCARTFGFGNPRKIGFCGAAPVPYADNSKELQQLKKEVEEQRNQIQTQKTEIDSLKKQRIEFERLRAFVCRERKSAEFCKGVN